MEKLKTFAVVVFVGFGVLASNAFGITVSEAVATAAEGAKAQGMEVLWEYVSPTEGVLIHRNPSTMRGCVVRFAYDGRSVTFEDTWYDVLDDKVLNEVKTAYAIREQLWDPASTLAAGDKAFKRGGVTRRSVVSNKQVEEEKRVRVEVVKRYTEGMSEKELKKWLKNAWKEAEVEWAAPPLYDRKEWLEEIMSKSPKGRARWLATYVNLSAGIVVPPFYERLGIPKEFEVEVRNELMKESAE